MASKQSSKCLYFHERKSCIIVLRSLLYFFGLCKQTEDFMVAWRYVNIGNFEGLGFLI